MIGPLPETTAGNKYVIVVVDCFSKWPEAKTVPTKEAIHIADFLYELFMRHGMPEVIISDQGREFCNSICDLLFAVEHRITSAYHPQTNGLTERFNQTRKDRICQMIENVDDDWDTKIPAILFSYRTSQHASTKFPPFFLFYNREPRLALDLQLRRPLEVTDIVKTRKELEHNVEVLVALKEQNTNIAAGNIARAQQRQKHDYDRRHNTSSSSFCTNDQVLLKNCKNESRKGGKLEVKWTGPYTISQCLGKGRFVLMDDAGVCRKQAIHACRLKKYYQPWTADNTPAEKSYVNQSPAKVSD